jgi:hypothetical protein
MGLKCVAIAVALFWVAGAGTASAEEPLVGFANTEPIVKTCADLFEGVNVGIRNESGEPQLARMRLNELEDASETSVSDAEVCGGLTVTPAKVRLPPGGSATAQLKSIASPNRRFTGSLVAFAPAGGVSRLGLTIPAASETGEAEVTLLSDKQSAQWSDLEPGAQEPIWIPVALSEAELSKVPLEEGRVLGTLVGRDSVLPVSYDGDHKRLTDSTSLLGLDVGGDKDPGSYSGKVDLLPKSEAGTVEISLTMTTWWLLPAILLVLGIATGVWVQRQIGLEQPLAQLRKRVESLGARYERAKEKLAGATTPAVKPWQGFAISDLPTLEASLLARVESGSEGVFIKLDEEVLKDLKAKVGAVETQIDLIAEVPDHALALEEAIKALHDTRPTRLPPLPAGTPDEERLVASSEQSLEGGAGRAEKLKGKLEAIDARVKQVARLAELEKRLGDLWSAAEGFTGKADSKQLDSLKQSLARLRQQLWTAEGDEDLVAASEEAQKARQQVFLLSMAQTIAPQGSAAEGQGPGTTVLMVEPAAPLRAVDLAGAAAVPTIPGAAPSPPSPATAPPLANVPALPPTPAPKLDSEEVDRRLERALRSQALVALIAALVAFSAGWQILYVGQPWGDSLSDWLATFAWGAAAQATVLALATSLDGLAALLNPRRTHS